MLKVQRVTLSEAVQIGGDTRRSWMADDETTIWLDDGNVLHVTRRGTHFATTNFVGAWGEVVEEKRKPVAKTKPEQAPA